MTEGLEKGLCPIVTTSGGQCRLLMAFACTQHGLICSSLVSSTSHDQQQQLDGNLRNILKEE